MLEFLLSPTQDVEAAKRFFLKALHSTAGSAPQACPVEEKVTQPTAPAHPNPTQSAPRVINVDKNAAYPKAIAQLKAAGILPESVELKPGQIPQQFGGAGPPLYQTVSQTGDGLLFSGNGRANATGLRGHAHDSQGIGQRGGQRRYPRADHLRRPPVWSGRLNYSDT